MVGHQIDKKIYDPIRFDLMRKGFRPRIVRMEEAGTLQEAVYDQRQKDSSEPERDAIKEVFGIDDPTEILAVVMFDNCDQEHNFEYRWATTSLSKAGVSRGAMAWVVPNRGSAYCVGSIHS